MGFVAQFLKNLKTATMFFPKKPFLVMFGKLTTVDIPQPH